MLYPLLNFIKEDVMYTTQPPIPAGYFQLFIEMFLKDFEILDDNHFKCFNGGDYDFPWIFKYNIFQYGGLHDEWVVEFHVKHNNIYLKAFMVIGFLSDLKDNFLEELLDVSDSVTISCPSCCSYISTTYGECLEYCPYCGEDLNVEQNITYTHIRDRYVCPHCETEVAVCGCKICGWQPDEDEDYQWNM